MTGIISVKNDVDKEKQKAAEKSHFKHKKNTCQLVNHLLCFHKGQDPQKILKITLLEAANPPEEARSKETSWTRRLFAFRPTGLNVREEES